MHVAPEHPPLTRSLADVPQAHWERLGRRRIFFGHQSVGQNILSGIQDVLARNPHIRLTIVESDDPADIDGPALIQAKIGHNGDPHSKADAFRRVMDGGFGSQGGVAMYKYCYVDVLPSTDVEELFEDYVEQMDSLARRYPGLQIVHVTLPLKRMRAGKRELVKRMLGRSTDTELNAKRNRYNELLLARYGGRAPVFDLAALESTRSDGTRSAVPYRRRQVFTLAPEWTDDGAHLNAAARRRVAEQLLVLLASLDDAGGAAATEAAWNGVGRAN